MNQDLYNIVLKLNSEGVVLNSTGIYTTKEEPFKQEEINQSIEVLKDAIKLIPFMVKKTTKKALVGSYCLKDKVEKHTGYLSNGQVILCMLYLNYRYLIRHQMNCSFFCLYAESDANKIS